LKNEDVVVDAVANMNVGRRDDVAVAMRLTFLEGRRDTVATVVAVSGEDGRRCDVVVDYDGLLAGIVDGLIKKSQAAVVDGDG
jgi:hypothetical protein